MTVWGAEAESNRKVTQGIPTAAAEVAGELPRQSVAGLGKEIKKLAKYGGLNIDEMGYAQQSRERNRKSG